MHNVTDVMLRRRTRQHRSLLFRYILVQSIYIYDVCVCVWIFLRRQLSIKRVQQFIVNIFLFSLYNDVNCLLRVVYVRVVKPNIVLLLRIIWHMRHTNIGAMNVLYAADTHTDISGNALAKTGDTTITTVHTSIRQK